MIEATHLHKQFGSVVAVEDVSFRAADGQITGLLGPNGAGKTTTLRILYTLMTPDRGTARVDGFDVVRERRSVQQRIGVLPDRQGLYPRLTARENIRYYGRLHGLKGEALERHIAALIPLLDMQEIADRRAQGRLDDHRLRIGESVRLGVEDVGVEQLERRAGYLIGEPGERPLVE